MTLYAYEITKVYAPAKNNPKNIKEGHIIFEDTFRGNYITLTYYDKKAKSFKRYYKAKFLFKVENDIWTEEGKKEFQQKLKTDGVIE